MRLASDLGGWQSHAQSEDIFRRWCSLAQLQKCLHSGRATVSPCFCTVSYARERLLGCRQDAWWEARLSRHRDLQFLVDCTTDCTPCRRGCVSTGLHKILSVSQLVNGKWRFVVYIPMIRSRIISSGTCRLITRLSGWLSFLSIASNSRAWQSVRGNPSSNQF